jgi:Zn-dependent protease
LSALTPEHIATWITYYVVLLFSVSVHESAHGWMALRMGDDTASLQGRISLNPLVHIDPIGTVLMPFLQLLFSPLGIPVMAWAKPTPVMAHNFRSLARGHVLVAAAGPVSNMILVALFVIAFALAGRLGANLEPGSPLVAILTAGITMNVGLAVFNLIPLPPLDGSWIASWGLPRPIANRYDRIMEPYGQWILLVLFFTGLLGLVVWPVVNLAMSVIKAFLSFALS